MFFFVLILFSYVPIKFAFSHTILCRGSSLCNILEIKNYNKLVLKFVNHLILFYKLNNTNNIINIIFAILRIQNTVACYFFFILGYQNIDIFRESMLSICYVILNNYSNYYKNIGFKRIYI